MKDKERLLYVKDLKFSLTITCLSWSDLQENMLELNINGDSPNFQYNNILAQKKPVQRKDLNNKEGKNAIYRSISNKQFVGKYAVLWTVYSEAKFFRYRPKNEFRKIHSKGF